MKIPRWVLSAVLSSCATITLFGTTRNHWVKHCTFVQDKKGGWYLTRRVHDWLVKRFPGGGSTIEKDQRYRDWYSIRAQVKEKKEKEKKEKDEEE